METGGASGRHRKRGGVIVAISHGVSAARHIPQTNLSRGQKMANTNVGQVDQNVNPGKYINVTVMNGNQTNTFPVGDSPATQGFDVPVYQSPDNKFNHYVEAVFKAENGKEFNCYIWQNGNNIYYNEQQPSGDPKYTNGTVIWGYGFAGSLLLEFTWSNGNNSLIVPSLTPILKINQEQQTFNPGGYVSINVTNGYGTTTYKQGDTPGTQNFWVPVWDEVNSDFDNFNITITEPEGGPALCYLWQSGDNIYYSNLLPTSYTDGTSIFQPGNVQPNTYYLLDLTSNDGAMVASITPF